MISAPALFQGDLPVIPEGVTDQALLAILFLVLLGAVVMWLLVKGGHLKVGTDTQAIAQLSADIAALRAKIDSITNSVDDLGRALLRDAPDGAGKIPVSQQLAARLSEQIQDVQRRITAMEGKLTKRTGAGAGELTAAVEALTTAVEELARNVEVLSEAVQSGMDLLAERVRRLEGRPPDRAP